MRTLYLGGMAVLLVAVFATWARGEPPASTLERDLERLRRVAPEPKAPPPAEIEESSDRDPVQPPPRPKAKPRKGQPDDRRITKHDSVKEAHERLISMAREAGYPVVKWLTYPDGGRELLQGEPDGDVIIKYTVPPPAPVRAAAPPPPPVRLPPVMPPPPVEYNVPPTYYQPMPRQEVAAGLVFPSRPGSAFLRSMGNSGAAPFNSQANGMARMGDDHRCPYCGHVSAPNTGNWIIRGGNPAGFHWHDCERCGRRSGH